MTWPAMITIILMGLFGLGFTFFPVQSMKFVYMLLECLCTLTGEEDYQKKLEYRYENFKDDPQGYAKKHSGLFIVNRIIGFVVLIMFIAFIKYLLIH